MSSRRSISVSDLYFLDFHDARERHRKRWERALEQACRVTQHEQGFDVEFEDDDNHHEVVLYQEGETFLGRCDCELMQRNPSDGPCVHLCRVRMEAVVDHVTLPQPDTRGEQREVACVD